jgi:hypothetical protein
MEDLVSELRTRFEDGLIGWASRADGPSVRDYTDEESKMLDIFTELLETVEAIPPDILRDAEELRARMPQSFEEILEGLIDRVGAKYESGGYFEPSNAAEFVQKLIEYVRLRETNPSLFYYVLRPDAVA